MEDQNAILNAIKTDDLSSFSHLVVAQNATALSFGRFPLLSLCYLFNSKKIVKKYEKQLLKIDEYTVVEEPFFIYQKFKVFAKKAVRLYFDETSVVSPLEMLAILHRDSTLMRVFKMSKRTQKIDDNLTKIYSTFSDQNVSIKNGKIHIGFRAISHNEKTFLFRVFASTLAILVIFSGAFFALDFTVGGLAFSPAKVYSSLQLVSAINGDAKIVLQTDLTLSGNFYGSFFGTIDGNGHTIYVSSSSANILETNDGTIENLNIVFTNSIQGTISGSSGLICRQNNGTIENVTVSFAESLTEQVSLNVSKTTSGSYFSGIAGTNNGTINSCTVTMQANISGSGSGDGFVSGIAGVNSGTVENCTVTESSTLVGDEIDLAGIVAVNKSAGTVKNCTNNASITQTSSQDNWSPNVAGVVGTNSGSMISCRNNGNLSVSSTFASSSSAVALCGGVASVNYGTLTKCKNVGTIEMTTDTLYVYCGGIVAFNKNSSLTATCLENCGEEGTLSVSTSAESAIAYVGGIAGIFYGKLEDCFSIATFTTASDSTKNFAGTAFGGIYYSYIYQYIDGEDNYVLSADNVDYQIGIRMNTGTSQSTGSQVVSSQSGSQDIKDLEVYFE